ncbi:MAG: hypothetical protein HQK76_19885 [Desulfobacterales bacterium]|nr:hypothetical protein [Desulfobacterales bacterium]
MSKRIPMPEVIVKKKNDIPLQPENQTEQKSQQQDKQKPRNFPPPVIDFWENFRGKEIFIESKNKRTINGILTAQKSGFLKIENATIVGEMYKVAVEWVWVERNAISHIYSKSQN